MAHNSIIAGLDIGTTKTCCVIAYVNLETGVLEVIGASSVESAGLKKGVVSDIDAATSTIISAADKAKHVAGNVDLRSFWVGVTGDHISSLNSTGVVAITNPEHEITKNDINRAIEQAKVIVLPPEREVLQVVPRDYIVDGQSNIADPVGMYAGRLEVETHIVTGTSSFLDNVAKCVERAGYSIEGRVFEPIATSEAAVFPAEKDLGVALADLGGGTIDVAIYTNGEIFYSSVLPFGGYHVTRDIAMGLRTDIDEAERIKIKYGCARGDDVDPEEGLSFTRIGAQPKEIQREVLVEIMEPRLRELIELVKEEIIKSSKIDLIPAGVVLTGGVALTPGIVELAEEVFELPVRVGCPQGIKGLSDTVETPLHSAAVGLAKYAAKNQTQLYESQKESTIKHGLKSLFSKWFK